MMTSSSIGTAGEKIVAAALTQLGYQCYLQIDTTPGSVPAFTDVDKWDDVEVVPSIPTVDAVEVLADGQRDAAPGYGRRSAASLPSN